mgnify:CR=1 FL=1
MNIEEQLSRLESEVKDLGDTVSNYLDVIDQKENLGLRQNDVVEYFHHRTSWDGHH